MSSKTFQNKDDSGQSELANADLEMKNSVQWLRKTVARIQELKLPANPHNYCVWYGYYSESNPDLSAEVDRLIADNAQFTNQLNQELYERHFVQNAERQLKAVRTAIRALISQLSVQLGALGDSMDGFDAAMSEIEVQLESEPDLDTLCQLISRALSETRESRKKNQQAQAMVSELGNELDAMKLTLEKLSVEALEDALTGLANRRAFDERLDEVLAQARDEDKSCSLLLLDIDRFKLVNDDYGHAVGDRVLCFVAEMIRKCIKGGDFVARFGGEEFAVILPSTDYFGGLAVARNISETIANRKLTVRKGGPGLRKITVSGGLSLWRTGDTAESLIDRADRCLYKAKSRGRNMVVGEKS